MTPIASTADNIVNRILKGGLPVIPRARPAGSRVGSWQILSHAAKFETTLQPRLSVDISMRKTEPLRKLAQMKKDARLTIRIPRELKGKIDGIDRVYGVALPKIANECLMAFCTYVEQKKQTPTFPLCISPHSPRRQNA
jgi:hypothetical protein